MWSSEEYIEPVGRKKDVSIELSFGPSGSGKDNDDGDGWRADDSQVESVSARNDSSVEDGTTEGVFVDVAERERTLALISDGVRLDSVGPIVIEVREVREVRGPDGVTGRVAAVGVGGLKELLLGELGGLVLEGTDDVLICVEETSPTVDGARKDWGGLLTGDEGVSEDTVGVEGGNSEGPCVGVGMKEDSLDRNDSDEVSGKGISSGWILGVFCRSSSSAKLIGRLFGVLRSISDGMSPTDEGQTSAV